MSAWRSRAARMYASDLADCPEPVRYTLLAALCWTRQAELIDSLVELLIRLIHQINARAEKRVEKELVGVMTGVPGKKGILRRMVDVSLARPEGTVAEVIFPARCPAGPEHCASWRGSLWPPTRRWPSGCATSCATPTPTTTALTSYSCRHPTRSSL